MDNDGPSTVISDKVDKIAVEMSSVHLEKKEKIHHNANSMDPSDGKSTTLHSCHDEHLNDCGMDTSTHDSDSGT